ncbi:DUF4115 domain-containing protein [Marinomonas sp. C2222]|uniref:DUF4115 domain-containing protein n=1 Tax=Marinomonas sargassi TaxID=2984494 RepID=A0ABT2YS43_9GAMM|nr:RodZ domain-containing protein [Marinomonas sargassi]MCV2402575.1 DUF4115 domain-containing protein [Marinomonas sargassi]
MTTRSTIDAAENTAISEEEIGSMEMINIGEQLSAQRLHQNLSVEHISKTLKITESQVTALESNDFGFFRSTTFARGYLKNYSKYLGLDTGIILSVFDDVLAHEKEPKVQFVDKVNKQTHFGDPIVIFISVVIVAILAFFVFWWPQNSSVVGLIPEDVKQGVEEVSPESNQLDPVNLLDQVDSKNVADAENDNEAFSSSNSADTDVQQEAPSEETSENVSVGESVAMEDEQTIEVVTGLSAETKAILADAGVNPEEVERTTQQVLEGKQDAELVEVDVEENSTELVVDDIEMTYVRDCWTEVRDATGRILFSGVKTAGSSLTLTGQAPYRVVLGYAKGVSALKFKGELVDISPYIRKDLARFELK